MSFEENSGINKLANVISERIKRETGKPLVLDFGEIQKNGGLVTNTFPATVPKGDYSVCMHLASGLVPGNRVLVAWVQSEAVVIDIVTRT